MVYELMCCLLATICALFMGISALFGGMKFIQDPTGRLIGIDSNPMKEKYGIKTFLVPGITLFVIFGCLSILGVFMAAFSKTRNFGLIILTIPGTLIWPWIFIQVIAYGWILKKMQIGVLVIGSLMTLFSFLALYCQSHQKIKIH